MKKPGDKSSDKIEEFINGAKETTVGVGSTNGNNEEKPESKEFEKENNSQVEVTETKEDDSKEITLPQATPKTKTVSSYIIDEPTYREIENLVSGQCKSYAMKIPFKLHKLAKEAAENCYPKVSLHNYIILALKEKLERDVEVE